MRHERARLILTALSPVHVGCGQDYAPYEYVDTDGANIAVFGSGQLMRAIPESARPRLAKAAQDPVRPEQKLQKLIAEFRDELLTQEGLRLIPKLATRLPDGTSISRIERTSFDPLTDSALLPGSSIKGALRTAWLGRHQELLKVGIPEDPLRMLAIADAPAVKEARALVFLQRAHKKPHANPGSPSSVRYDYLLEAIQRRGKFQADLVLRQPEPSARVRGNVGNIVELVAAANAHYKPELDSCLAYLADMKRGFGYGADWVTWIDNNINQRTGKAKDPKTGEVREVTTFGGMMAEGRGFLLRLGKHGGAESLTLPGLRKLKTKYGTETATLTMTLTANDTSQPNKVEPFGWVFVQILR
jgi:CRISPR-associated protein Csm5